MLLRTIIGSAIVLITASASEVPREVNICELIRLASQLDGKVVRLSGVLRNSETPEDPSFDELVPETCSDAKDRQTVVHIVSPDVHFLANPPQGYKPDMDSMRRAQSILKKAAVDGKSVSVKVEGVFQIVRQETSMPPRHKRYSASIVIQALREAKER